jgi:SRSO17 transposase
MVDWDKELSVFLQPFLEKLGHKKRRQMCPLYVSGLIGPGDRKSIEPMAERFAPGQYDRLHHFISDGLWDAVPLETELALQADRIVGASDAFLVIDDTGLPKKGDHSVGVAPQYASMLGKRANCQTLVSVTLARDEVPVPVGLRCSCRIAGSVIRSAWLRLGSQTTCGHLARSRRLLLPRSIG